MNRNDVSMQLYTTRKFQPYEQIFKFLSESGIKNIELFDLDKIDLDNFKSMMYENDISIKSSHISFQAITDTDETIRRMKFLNIRHAIVPSVPEKFNKDFASNFDLDEDTWNSFGKDLSSYVQIYEDNGLTLGYHNHSFEFRPLPTGKLPIECMMDHNENLKMELDLGWAVAGKADPLDWIEKYKNKIIGCHLKDFYDQTKNLLEHDQQSAVGEGFIDWSTLISEVKKTPCEVFVLEHDDPKDYKEYTTKSLEYLETI